MPAAAPVSPAADGPAPSRAPAASPLPPDVAAGPTAPSEAPKAAPAPPLGPAAPPALPMASEDLPAPPPTTPHHKGLWAVPALLSLLFVLGALLWVQRNDRAEREELHRVLISDALSLEAQLRGGLDVEAAHLRSLAAQLTQQPSAARGPATLAASPEVGAGFRRLWISVTWLDANNRILAHLPEQLPTPLTKEGTVEDGTGVSSHLVAAVGRTDASPFDANRFDIAGEKLVVRFSPVALLKRGTPWWLTRRYVVQLVDGSDQVIASLDDAPLPAVALRDGRRDSYRVQAGGGMPGVYLELIEREPRRPWWFEPPWGVIGGFLVLIAVATALLRRQMRQIRHAERAWRTEVAWRSAMEDSALVGLRARDAEGRLLYVNRTFCEMVGLSAAELLGRLPPMPYWPPDGVEEAMQRSQRNLAGLAPREGYEARWCRRDGQVVDVMVFESPLVNAQGEQIGWMGSIIDITAHKQLQERERRQSEAMAHQARLTMLGEVASALAHQLNQPLTAIAGYNAGALRMLERTPGTEAVLLQALRRLGEQAAEAGRIVQRIREFLTRRAPQREPVALAQLVPRALALLQRDMQRQQVQLQHEQPDALPEVLADAVLVEQVLLNLVRNAADELVAHHAPQRRIRVVARVVPSAADGQGPHPVGAPAASPAALPTGGPAWVQLEVHDSGPGLRGRSIDQLCAPFYSTKPEGMGMGLAICRSVIEAHHGRLAAAASPLLGGAWLAFTLPPPGGQEEDEAAAAAAVASAPPEAARPAAPPPAPG